MMKQHRVLGLGMVFAALLIPATAAACRQMPPEAALIARNDGNQDRRLSRAEWRRAAVGDFFVAFRLGDAAEFARLDQNRDGYLNAEELADQVRYRREPCADWQDIIRLHPMPSPETHESHTP
ncbi:hypothetical protein L1281_000738 [Neisseria sp. HSC-16F19]|nr:UDP-glucose 6-dehydrogenase [Neisseria sp. HSC-16F19]MCP2040158.1 hypothetical protein [Neisseria sp. HSC-16F19]